MSLLTPYLCVPDARAAIQWYGEVLGARVSYQPIEMPDGRIGHVELTVDLAAGEAGWMMADAFPEAGVEPPDPDRGSAITLHLSVSDVDGLCDRAVAAGAVLEREPQDNPVAGRVGVFRDPFGHRWFLNTPLPQ